MTFKKKAFLVLLLIVVGFSGWYMSHPPRWLGPGPQPMVDNYYRLIDVIIINGFVDVPLPPEWNFTNEEFTAIALKSFKEKFETAFPDSGVKFSSYGNPYTLETNPFGIRWEFHLSKREGGGSPYRWSITSHRYKIVKEISSNVWREGYKVLDSYWDKFASLRVLNPVHPFTSEHYKVLTDDVPLGKLCCAGGGGNLALFQRGADS